MCHVPELSPRGVHRTRQGLVQVQLGARGYFCFFFFAGALYSRIIQISMRFASYALKSENTVNKARQDARANKPHLNFKTSGFLKTSQIEP